MNEIKTTKAEVKRILEAKPQTRNNDMILYYEYCLHHWVRDVQMYKVFQDTEFRRSKNIAPFETVSRARREIQHECVNLRSDEVVEQAKKVKEEMFRNYYGGKNI